MIHDYESELNDIDHICENWSSSYLWYGFMSVSDYM